MRQLRILAPTRYPWRFNGPRRSRHTIVNKAFLPLNKIHGRMEGITLFPTAIPGGYDLTHAFNRIPIGATPYLIGFESHLPRAYHLERTPYYRTLRHSLASGRCRGIIAISRHAESIFRDTHAGSDVEAELNAKLELRYPNLALPDAPDGFDGDLSTLRLVFVGGHFARKGGCVAVRLAELASARGVPIEVTIVSALEMGGGIWTDPADDSYYESWRARLDHPSIRFHPALPNSDVLALFRKAHFSLLATFGDTFGYSALEAMMVHCPVIATRQGALPEFIEDGVNGILMDLPLNRHGEWVHSSSPHRATKSFEAMFTDEVERLAQTALERIVALLGNSPAYAAMRKAARRTVEERFNAEDANRYWDERYLTAIAAGRG